MKNARISCFYASSHPIGSMRIRRKEGSKERAYIYLCMYVAAYQDKEEANKGRERCGAEKGTPQRDKQSGRTQAEERRGAVDNGSLPPQKQGEEEAAGPEAPSGEEGPVAIGEDGDSDRSPGGEEEVLAGLHPRPPEPEQADVLHHHIKSLLSPNKTKERIFKHLARPLAYSTLLSETGECGNPATRKGGRLLDGEASGMDGWEKSESESRERGRSRRRRHQIWLTFPHARLRLNASNSRVTSASLLMTALPFTYKRHGQ